MRDVRGSESAEVLGLLGEFVLPLSEAVVCRLVMRASELVKKQWSEGDVDELCVFLWLDQPPLESVMQRLELSPTVLTSRFSVESMALQLLQVCGGCFRCVCGRRWCLARTAWM